MTDTQLYLAIGIPTLLIFVTTLLGILLNQSAITRVENRLTVIEGDLRRFYQILGEHSAKIDNLEKPR
jgi:hypothetical protein